MQTHKAIQWVCAVNVSVQAGDHQRHKAKQKEDSRKKEDPGEGTKQQMKTRSAGEAVTRRKPNFKRQEKTSYQSKTGNK